MDDNEKKEGTAGVMPNRLSVVPPEREGQLNHPTRRDRKGLPRRPNGRDAVSEVFDRRSYYRRVCSPIAHPRDDPRPADWARAKRRDG